MIVLSILWWSVVQKMKWTYGGGSSRTLSRALFAAGLSESYLLLPLMHYLLFAPAEYRYISSSVNFVASRWWVQALCLLVAGLQALAAAWLERTWARRAGARP